jgi:tetratricopeptide (TPR) repeat protein
MKRESWLCYHRSQNRDEVNAAMMKLFLWLPLLAISLATGPIHADHKPDPALVEGDNAYKAGNYDLAVSKYSEAIKRNPKDPIAYNGRGLAYKERKEYAQAIGDFTEALRLKQDWFVFYNRGITYHEKGAEDPAIIDFTKALKLTPKDVRGRVDCLIGRAHCYFNKEKAVSAMADLSQAIELGVKEPDAYVLRGILHKIDHDYDRSLADYEKAISLDPNDARSYDAEAYLLSVCPMPKYRDAKKAIVRATKACEITEWKYADALETLAVAYAEAGQFDDAIKWQAKAGEIDPKAVDEKRLELYQQKQPFRDINRKELPFANLDNIKHKVTIKIGQRTNAHFRVDGDQLVDPNVTQTNNERTDSVTLDFRRDKRGKTLFLTHSFPTNPAGEMSRSLEGLRHLLRDRHTSSPATHD